MNAIDANAAKGQEANTAQSALTCTQPYRPSM